MSTPRAKQPPKPGSRSERFLRLDRADANIDAEARTATLAFASATPVDRAWGVEILDMKQSSIRTGRIDGTGALLMDHDPTDQVGVIDSVQIGSDQVARAVVRFGRSARANEVFQDVVDGIRRNVSVGYMVHDVRLESETNGMGTYRITDWEPYEISIVSVPADTSVGVGRQMDIDEAQPDENEPESAPESESELETPVMSNESSNAAPIDVDGIRSTAQQHGIDAERKRTADIIAAADTLARYPKVRDIAAEALRGGWSVDQFRAKALEAVTTEPLPNANIGMSQQEVRRYSIVRALNALANPTDQRAREEAKFELEVSESAAAKLSRAVKGVLVPYDVLQGRSDDYTKGTAGKGGNLIATELLSADFITLLRNAMVIDGLGARYLTGLVGNIAIPRQSGGSTAYWVAESGAGTNSSATFDQVALSPKTVLARSQISRKLLLQSSLDVEAFVRYDLATTLGLAIQQAAIVGGGSNQPVGILSVPGIGSVVGGTNGAAPTWANIIGLETAVATANANVGTLGYLTNAAVRGKLKGTQQFSGNAPAIWLNGDTPLNGYQAAVTNAVPSNGTKGTGTNLSSIIFGNFADLIVGIWGGLELQVDPYSAGDSGSVVVRAFQDVDVAVRHPESFAAMTDAVTA